MEAVREKWTDERLDDLNLKVDQLGRRVDEGFSSIRVEMNTRFDASQRTMVQLFAVAITACVGLIGAQTALLLMLL